MARRASSGVRAGGGGRRPGARRRLRRPGHAAHLGPFRDSPRRRGALAQGSRAGSRADAVFAPMRELARAARGDGGRGRTLGRRRHPGRGPLPRLAHPALPRLPADLLGRRAARRPSAAPGPGRLASGRAAAGAPAAVVRRGRGAGDGHGADAGAVLAAAAGNPFFVTEVLANPGVEVPATVEDAVLARLSGLSEPTQRALELLSHRPRAGALALGGGAARRRHDGAGRGRAARRAGPTQGTSGSATSWPPGGRAQQPPPRPGVAGNRRVLARLRPPPGVELSRLTHHAHQCRRPRGGRPPAWPPPARRPAPAPSAQALAHYELVLRWSASCRSTQRATVLEESLGAAFLPASTGVARAGEVVALRRRTGDQPLGQALTTLSRMRYMANDQAGQSRP